MLGGAKTATFEAVKKNNDINVATTIMACSLLLLAIFVFMWLKRVYQDEYENLQRDVDFVFINSIRDLESDLMLASRSDRVIIMTEDSSFNTQWESEVQADLINQKDSLNIHVNALFPDSIVGKQKVAITVARTESVLINGQNGHPPSIIQEKHIEDGFKGAISLFVNIDGVGGKIPMSLKDSLYLKNLIGENLKQKMKKEGTYLPVKFQIVTPKDDAQKGFLSQSYTDVMTGQSFSLKFEDFKPILYKKMWQEVAFALILILSVAFSFWFVYRSLLRQNRLTEVKNDLVRNITHELKTPITTVGVAIEALDNFDVKNNPQRQKEYLDISRHELNRLSILVDKVLTTSLFDKKQATLNIEEIDFDELVSRVIRSMRIQFEKTQAVVQYQTSGANFTIKGDRIHLTNVVYNLLENAIKYSVEHPEIAVHLATRHDGILLSVCDRGIGIPHPYLTKVFEAFFRVPTGDRHNVKGHGLGLAYVADVVQKHHGTIRVENRKSGGVCFKMSL